MSWERLTLGSEWSLGWRGRTGDQVHPPGTWGAHGAVGPSVTGSISQSFKPALLLEKWLSSALAWVPK